MCGLTGIFDRRGLRPIPPALLAAMNDRLSHRGPDGDGTHVEPGLGLGHRRLAVIDLSGGKQPLYNEDRTVTVVFNGEIYNFGELMQELIGAGHTFRTRSDTEVIVHAWEQWREKCVERFRGMFAFALWDGRTQELFLARDRMGEKPLYYTELGDGLLLFASELKALLAHPGVRQDLDPTAVDDFFAFGYVPEPKAIYRGIRKLPAAHRLLVRRGGEPLEPRPYWKPCFSSTKTSDERALAEELASRLREAVTLQLVADVPVGAFLSGGVDSSGVVAMMAASCREAVRSFAIGFGDGDFDELPMAAAVAERYGTRHVTKRVVPQFVSQLDGIARIYDEPFADHSAVPTHQVSMLARQDVTVALTGDGGDELFAGYRRYKWHAREERLRAFLPPPLRKPIFGTLGALYPKLDRAPRWLRAKYTLQELALGTAEGYFRNVCKVQDGLRHALYSASMRRDIGDYHPGSLIARHMAEAETADPLQAAQYVDMKTYLPGDILVKGDRASMATSLELRIPLLDHPLVEFAMGVPSDLKLRSGEGKHLLKKSLEPYVPHENLYRAKRGFAVDIGARLRGRDAGEVRRRLSEPSFRDSGLFDPSAVSLLLDQHMSGALDHGAALWSLLVFSSFLSETHAAARPQSGTLDRPLVTAN